MRWLLLLSAILQCGYLRGVESSKAVVVSEDTGYRQHTRPEVVLLMRRLEDAEANPSRAKEILKGNSQFDRFGLAVLSAQKGKRFNLKDLAGFVGKSPAVWLLENFRYSPECGKNFPALKAAFPYGANMPVPYVTRQLFEGEFAGIVPTQRRAYLGSFCDNGPEYHDLVRDCIDTSKDSKFKALIREDYRVICAEFFDD